MSDHHHSHRHDPAERFAEAQNVTWVSVAVNVVLTVLQIVIGIIGKSQALVADGMHSLSDLLSDFLVLFANRHSAKHADSAHPYGHGRIETATTLALGVILMGTGATLVWGAAQRLQEPTALQQVHVMTLWIALLTLFGKEGLFHYMRHVARKLKSRMLEANAWHARGDAASSLVVVAGIGGNLAGITSLDLLAAALVAAMIFRMGWKQAHSALMELIDTGLDEKEVEAIRQTLIDTPGVLGLHELRTRRMGDRALIDAHVLVEPRISVSEGHHIAENARARVVSIHDALDVMVHIDPEDDAQTKRISHLPPRDELVRQLENALELPDRNIHRIGLHYLEGRVEADIFVGANNTASQLVLAAQSIESQDNIFSHIRLYQEIAPE
ncbi:MAG: cation diffusion facilitator family transporter [Sulfuricellaceae bacterium]|nr:cation diffusion facilitator family transporter [Sulfuricellaceae bacterium]